MSDHDEIPSVPAQASAPLVVVGLPRSGSTIATRLLNDCDGVFVINDFYVLQAIDAEDLWDRTDPEAAGRVAALAFERIRIRATQESGKTLNQSIDLDAEGLAAVERAASGPFAVGTTWHDALGMVLGAAARAAGCRRWGWNTPQDHLHIARIIAAWPQARFLFVLRQPRAVLASYKNASGPWHEARRYNPATIGLAWRKAADALLAQRAARPDETFLLRYEDMIADPDATRALLASFTQCACAQGDVARFEKNSSFTGGRASLPVTDSELWIAEKVIAGRDEALGFRSERAQPRLGDGPAVLSVLARSGLFFAGQMFNPDRRRRAARLLFGK